MYCVTSTLQHYNTPTTIHPYNTTLDRIEIARTLEYSDIYIITNNNTLKTNYHETSTHSNLISTIY